MPSKQKNKGKSGERELSKILSGIFNEYENFCRVIGSGQLFGGKNFSKKNEKNTYQKLAGKGDIVPPPGLENLSFECKWYAKSNFISLLKEDENKRLESWINQILVTNEGEYWFLCMKFNYEGWFVLVDPENLKDFLPKNISYFSWYCKNKNKTYLVYDLKNFFQEFKKLYSKNKKG